MAKRSRPKIAILQRYAGIGLLSRIYVYCGGLVTVRAPPVSLIRGRAAVVYVQVDGCVQGIYQVAIVVICLDVFYFEN